MCSMARQVSYTKPQNHNTTKLTRGRKRLLAGLQQQARLRVERRSLGPAEPEEGRIKELHPLQA